MIRFFILRIVLPFLLFLLLRSVLKGLFGGMQAPRRAPRPQVPAGGELRRDPVCGTYVSTVTGITSKSHGEIVYFCSEECRKKFV
jgi:uncharacterized protein